MPTYTVTTTLSINKTRKQQLAKVYARLAEDFTDAAPWVHQTVFNFKDGDDYYNGGVEASQLAKPIVWVNIQMYEGRSQEQKKKVMDSVREETMNCFQVHRNQILVYIIEVGRQHALADMGPHTLEKKEL